MKICTKCGARMSDSNRFCEKCGSTLVTETAAGHTAVPVRSETSLSQLVGWLQKYGRHIMRVAALLAVVLFFCPLFLVSCEGVQMNVSGFQTATGFGFDDDGNTKSSWFLSEEDNSRYYTQDNASLPQGSLTAFAALLLAHPELKCKIARISLMGGGIATGNWTPAAEFNILVDPEAARIVFTSGVPITMAGLDVTEKALIMPEDFERVRALGNPVSDIVAQWLEFFYRFHRSIGYAGAPMHDPCAVMALIHPEIFTIRPMYVQIETAGEYCRGTTVGDLLGFSGHAPNADVLMDVDRGRFADLLVEAIKFYGEAEA